MKFFIILTFPCFTRSFRVFFDENRFYCVGCGFPFEIPSTSDIQTKDRKCASLSANDCPRPELDRGVFFAETKIAFPQSYTERESDVKTPIFGRVTSDNLLTNFVRKTCRIPLMGFWTGNLFREGDILNLN